MNEVIKTKNEKLPESNSGQEIEDAVLVEENKSLELAEVPVAVTEESQEVIESIELPDIDELKTLEEIDGAFTLVKDDFLSLAGEETNETIKSGKNILVHFDRVSKNDETVEKNIKLKYLKGLNLCVEELKSSNSNSEKSQKEEGSVELTETEKTIDPEIVENKEYKIAREEWKKTKEAHREKKQEYDKALSEFYGNQSKFDKSINSVKKFFGFNPELPPEIKELEKNYKSERNKYAVGLNSALKERGNLNGNKEHLWKYNKNAEEKKVNIYDEKSDSFKVAFADKFILRPNQELLAKQENVILSESKRETLARISQMLGKHKWHIRGGMIFMAGTAGAMTGGLAALLAGAGWQAWKIAAGAAAGAGVGIVTKKAMQGRVDRAESDIEKQTLKFDVNKLEALEQDLLEAVGTRDRNLRQQKVASIAAAVIAGGVTSYNLAGIDANEAVSTVNEKTNDILRVTEIEIAKVIDAHQVEYPISENAVSESLETGEDMTTSFEMPIIKSISIPDYSLDGTKNFQTVIMDLKINSQGNLAESLNEVQRNSVEQYVRLVATDQLSAHPNISQENLEGLIFEKLQNKFAGEDWWKTAEVKGIDISSIERTSYVGPSSEAIFETEPVTSVETSSKTELASDSAEKSHTVVVKKNDNLWNIVKNQYSTELNGLSTVEQNQVIDKLLDKVNADPALMKAINPQIKDIDLIYPDQKINIGVLEEELKKLVDLEKNDADVSYTKSSPIPVEAQDPGVNKVKINFAADPIGFDAPPPNPVPADNLKEPLVTPISPQEALGIKEVKFNLEPPTRSINDSLNDGNYFRTKEYHDYVLKVFGNEKNFNTVLNKEVKDVDGLVYDLFNTRSEYKNFYEVYGALPLSEFNHFQQLESKQINALLTENNIKYEAYLAWQDKIKSILNTDISRTPKTTIADLFSRFVVEDAAEKLNNTKT